MTPEKFIITWKNNPLTERAGAQAHFDDFCDLLGVAKSRDPENDCFERGAKKAGGGDGWTDYTVDMPDMPDMPDEEISRRLLALNLQRSHN